MKSAFDCEVCGNPLPSFSKGYVCSDTCRKRKSRLRLDAGKNAMNVRNGIRMMIKGLELDVIDTNDVYDEFHEISELLTRFVAAYKERSDREMRDQERKKGRDKNN